MRDDFFTGVASFVSLSDATNISIKRFFVVAGFLTGVVASSDEPASVSDFLLAALSPREAFDVDGVGVVMFLTKKLYHDLDVVGVIGDAALALAKGDLCARGVVFDALVAFKDDFFCVGLYSTSDSASSDESSSSSPSLLLNFFLRLSKVFRFLADDLRELDEVAELAARLRLLAADVEGVAAVVFDLRADEAAAVVVLLDFLLAAVEGFSSVNSGLGTKPFSTSIAFLSMLSMRFLSALGKRKCPLSMRFSSTVVSTHSISNTIKRSSFDMGLGELEASLADSLVM
ncbi:hypothetical protein FF38_13433 [Lucilia cuprina]|uniref:Uncharacterized protein n=1 Tax=Lucilia cuprina TaxID=7375 RepID=A0A0L0BNJ9_LUCCU|nr:hypothetical protein FF38_13433 [Lucilia cuprina]